jgi:hypothetical protein
MFWREVSRLGIGLAAVSMLLGGCTSPNGETRPVLIGSAKGVSTTGSTRVITERRRDGHVVCTEPSPDYAIAFGATRSLTVNAPPPAAGAAAATVPNSITGTSNTTEAIHVPGQERSQAVMALRDGLYAACQSYANGVIGHDAYAIILSQYGALLVALVSTNAEKAGGGKGEVVGGGRNPALSALTVACVSNYDRTRSAQPSNTLLTPAFCLGVFRSALNKV